MRTLILLTAFVATSVFADTDIKVNRIEMSSAAVEEVEETTEKADDTKAPATDYNSSRSNKRGAQATDYNSSRPNKQGVQADDSGNPKVTPRDAASGLPTGKRQHRTTADFDGDDNEDTVETKAPVEKERKEADQAKSKQ
jgi:hypothetical protein